MTENEKVNKKDFDLTSDLVEFKYFEKINNLTERIAHKIYTKTKKLLSDKKLSTYDKFDYLKHHILDRAPVFDEVLECFLIEYKRVIIFESLKLLGKKGFIEAKALYRALANDKKIKKSIEKLEKRRRWFEWKKIKKF